MRILYIVPYVPDLVRVRPYNLIRFLARSGHEVTVAAVFTSQAERESLEQLNAFCASTVGVSLSSTRTLFNSLRALLSTGPIQASYAWHPGLVELAYQMLTASQPYDVVHVEHLRGARFGLALKEKITAQAGPVHMPVMVWDSVDCISYLFRQTLKYSQNLASRWMARLDLKRTERFERTAIDQFERVLVTSQADKTALLDLIARPASPPNISVVTNGVDLDYFTPDPSIQREPETIVVSGKMSYHANITMVEFLVNEIMPAVWAQRPNTRLSIVGKNPPQKIRAYADHPNITVTGYVADIRPYLLRATLAAAPLVYGAGIQNKVLEAMACGTPVVTTSQALNSLQAAPGKDLYAANGPQEFAQSILHLLNDANERESLGQAGRKYVEKQHNWIDIAATVAGIYQEQAQQAKEANRFARVSPGIRVMSNANVKRT